MSRTFSPMSLPPSSGPPPGYGAPPPGYGPPPKKNNTATIIIIVLAVVFGGGLFVTAILAAILFPVFVKVRGNARLAACESNVKQIDLGMLQYVQDNNEKYPASAAGYKSVLMPYIKSNAVFHCPADQGGEGDYSMNSKLQGVSLKKLTHPEVVVAVYEGKNQTLDFRHDGRAVVGFADGHFKAFTQAQAEGLQWKP